LKILYVGDQHVRVSNLEESKRLILFVVEQANKHDVDRIVLLGDANHNHDVLRLQVVEFWTWAFELLNQGETVVLVGNHDRSNNLGDTYSALAVFSLMGLENVSIINSPIKNNIFAYVPYIHDQTEFVKASNELYDQGARVLVCHADWDGGVYDNGYYCPNGIKPELLKFDLVIGGHIHKRQRFGKVILPGTPRWDTASDANESKGLWLVDHDDLTGAILKEEFISTEEVCQPIISLTYREGDVTIPTWASNAKVALELVGSSVWVAQEKLKFKGRCSISTKFTDTKKIITRDPGKGFEDFLSNLFVSTSDKSELLIWAKELGII
jgi:DNA repair exonuclease SbcCD nuclease subunit